MISINKYYDHNCVKNSLLTTQNFDNNHILAKNPNSQDLQFTFDDKSFDFNLSYWCDNSLCPKKSISMFSRSISFLAFE